MRPRGFVCESDGRLKSCTVQMNEKQGRDFGTSLGLVEGGTTVNKYDRPVIRELKIVSNGFLNHIFASYVGAVHKSTQVSTIVFVRQARKNKTSPISNSINPSQITYQILI